MPVASGGDGDSTQFWYVGYDPVLDEVVVAHQGTDTSKLWVIDLIVLSTDNNFKVQPAWSGGAL